jgi:hypothetical protein
MYLIPVKIIEGWDGRRHFVSAIFVLYICIQQAEWNGDGLGAGALNLHSFVVTSFFGIIDVSPGCLSPDVVTQGGMVLGEQEWDI